MAEGDSPILSMRSSTGEMWKTRRVSRVVCREVLASQAVLNIPERADWKECKQTREEEDECCKRLRDDFQPFDFALDD